jgi:hypothetical protein
VGLAEFENCGNMRKPAIIKPVIAIEKCIPNESFRQHGMRRLRWFPSEKAPKGIIKDTLEKLSRLTSRVSVSCCHVQVAPGFITALSDLQSILRLCRRPLTGWNNRAPLVNFVAEVICDGLHSSQMENPAKQYQGIKTDYAIAFGVL